MDKFRHRLVGEFSWQPPSWIKSILTWQKNIKMRMGSRNYWLSWLFAIVVLLIATALLLYYITKPTPNLVAAQLTIPAIAAIEKAEQPTPLMIQFTQPGTEAPLSVAPLAQINQFVNDAVEITPEIAGNWLWSTGDTLLFTPESPWPAGTHYEVKLKDSLLANHFNLADHHYEFTTTPLDIVIKHLRFQENLLTASENSIMATLEFNYPIAQTELEQHLALRYQTTPQQPGDAISYQLTYAESQREVILKSANLPVPEQDRFAELTITAGVAPIAGKKTEKNWQETVVIPAINRLLTVEDVTSLIVRDPQTNEPQKILKITTNLAVTSQDLAKSLTAKLIPNRINGQFDTNYWLKTAIEKHALKAQVTDLILQPLASATISSTDKTTHFFRYNAPDNHYLAISIERGLPSVSGYLLGQTMYFTTAVPDYPQELDFTRSGSLLSLTDEKRLTLMTRGLKGVKFTVSRIEPDDLNQFITQTQGEFQTPIFIDPYRFNADNISQVFIKKVPLNAYTLADIQYASLDLSPYLPEKTPQVGLFLVKAESWDPENDITLGMEQIRTILITDLGAIVKENGDQTRDIFIQSINSGQPVSQAEITVMGKNGFNLMTTITDQQGHAQLPNLTTYRDEKQPIALLIRHQDDIAFIPLQSGNRLLNYSRFNIGGISYPEKNNILSAFIFSDRGLYQPNETVHLAFIIKNARWKDGLMLPAQALPLKLIITDPSGKSFVDQAVNMPAHGLFTQDIHLPDAAMAGTYYASLYVMKNDQLDQFLGQTSFEVKAFQPDSLRLTSTFNQPATNAWLQPDALQAKVHLENLFGFPAANHRVNATMYLSPAHLSFAEFAGFEFYDPFYRADTPPKSVTLELTPQSTDEQGNAEMNLDLSAYDNAIYHIDLIAEGFEQHSGQSVTHQLTQIISPLTTMVGVKTNGALDNIQQDTLRQIQFIAINQQRQAVPLEQLQLRLYRIQPVTTLVENKDGSYEYQVINQPQKITETAFTIKPQGSYYPLATDQVGQFALELWDQQQLVSKVLYQVNGMSSAYLTKRPELEIKLDKPRYNPGDAIEVAISAPYSGAGLITIESDKVQAFQWFQADTTHTVQTITLPEQLRGNAYINVLWLRHKDSDERYINPLSYGVIPFTINHDAQQLTIDLSAPELVKPGETFTVDYRTSEPSQLILFGVDQGILQRANYSLPDPLAFFFQKQQLSVNTTQTLDLVMPRYQRAKPSTPGGGQQAATLAKQQGNPFKRRLEKPVIFWSGLLHASPQPQKQSVTVPDYFNGRLQVMAIAVNDQRIGAKEQSVTVRGDYIITPSLPAFVSPGDEFTVAVSVTAGNLPKDATDSVVLELIASGFSLLDSAEQHLNLTGNTTTTVLFKLRADQQLGAVPLQFIVKGKAKQSQLTVPLSIRPLRLYENSVISGIAAKGKASVPVDIQLYPQRRLLQVSSAYTPAIFVTGLMQQLANNLLDTTVQISSQLLAMISTTPQQHIKQSEQYPQIQQLLEKLRLRQNNQGAFANWNQACQVCDPWVSIYTMDVLTSLQERGLFYDKNAFSAGLHYLQNIAETTPDDVISSQQQAYAIYVLTRNAVVTSNVITHLVNYLERQENKTWERQLTASYLAASYQLLQQSEAAQHWIQRYRITENNTADNAQYLQLLKRHFPQTFLQLSPQDWNHYLQQVTASVNSDLAAARSIALLAEDKQPSDSPSAQLLTIQQQVGKQKQTLASAPTQIKQADFSAEANQLLFKAEPTAPFFYQINTRGYSTEKYSQPLAQGLAIDQKILDTQMQPITQASLGKDVTVEIKLRAQDNAAHDTIAVISLLPGGFEIIPESIDSYHYPFVSIQEDRVIFFTHATDEVTTLHYKLRPINPGQYTFPAVSAWEPDQPHIRAHGTDSTIEVGS